MPDADLPGVLAGAALGVQPSLYEGFGLPILEQMASGQVVAASNASSHPEVGGAAADYFDPKNVEEMTAVLHRLLTDKDEYTHPPSSAWHGRQAVQLGECSAGNVAIYAVPTTPTNYSFFA